MLFAKQIKELDNIVQRLLYNSETIFFGLFISEVNRSFDTCIDTACLATHAQSRKHQMIFNPSFWDNLTEEERIYLVLHETYHLFETHYLFSLDHNWDSSLANIAMDLRINSELNDLSVKFENKKSTLKIAIPEGGLQPTQYPELNLLELQGSKYYYDILNKKKSEKEKSKVKGEDSKAGKTGNQQGTSGCKQLDEQLDDNKDLHPLWESIIEGMSEVEKELLKREIAQAVERIAEETEKSKGNLPLSIQNAIKNQIKPALPVVSWKTLFRRFVGSNITTETYSTRKKPNVRFPDSPGTKYTTKVAVGFFSDSSGSVSQEELERCWSELNNVYKAGGKIFYASWDGKCADPVDYKGTRQGIARTKAGGTIIDSAIQKINDTTSKNKYSFCVITTDGHIGGITVKCKVPLLLLITSNGTTKFSNPFNYKTIKIN